MGERPSAWSRVIAAAEEHDPRFPLTWLATQLDYTVQRVQNWKDRGIPAREYEAVAAVFGESIEWVAGLAPRKRTVAGLHLDDDALAFAVQYQKLLPYQRTVLRKLFDVAQNTGPPQVTAQDLRGGVDTSYDELHPPTTTKKTTK